MEKEYEDIPGTFVFDADRSREGYHLNQFCISLGKQKGRDAYTADPEGYLASFKMTEDQRQAVRDQDRPLASRAHDIRVVPRSAVTTSVVGCGRGIRGARGS